MNKMFWFGISLVTVGALAPIAFVILNAIQPMPDIGAAIVKVSITSMIVIGYGLRVISKNRTRKANAVTAINKELQGTGYILKIKH